MPHLLVDCSNVAVIQEESYWESKLIFEIKKIPPE